jgi:hypothetical protein
MLQSSRREVVAQAMRLEAQCFRAHRPRQCRESDDDDHAPSELNDLRR